VELFGIVPTRFKQKTLEHAEMLQALVDAFGEKVWEPMQDRIIWSEAARAYRPTFSYAPDSQAAQDAWKMIDRAEEALANVPS
jgi:cellulose biosynthesis protein BcsQ